MAASRRVVTSPANEGVKQVVRLRKARERRASGLFVVEGFREVRRALAAGVEVETLWFCPELYLGPREQGIVEEASSRGISTVEAAAGPFRKMAYRDRPEGLLAVCRHLDVSLSRIELGERPLVLVCESIEKPGNLGTMIRAASAAGADAVLVADPTTDVFNPNVVRASIGLMFSMPLAMADSDEAIAWLCEHGARICAAVPGGDLAPWDAPLDESVAIVVGAEQYGLSEAWTQAADLRVRIPMPGDDADSLNASAAAAVLLFEAVRQRST